MPNETKYRSTSESHSYENGGLVFSVVDEALGAVKGVNPD
jgi:hypothetical protein